MNDRPGPQPLEPLPSPLRPLAYVASYTRATALRERGRYCIPCAAWLFPAWRSAPPDGERVEVRVVLHARSLSPVAEHPLAVCVCAEPAYDGYDSDWAWRP